MHSKSALLDFIGLGFVCYFSPCSVIVQTRNQTSDEEQLLFTEMASKILRIKVQVLLKVCMF